LLIGQRPVGIHAVGDNPTQPVRVGERDIQIVASGGEGEA